MGNIQILYSFTVGNHTTKHLHSGTFVLNCVMSRGAVARKMYCRQWECPLGVMSMFWSGSRSNSVFSLKWALNMLTEDKTIQRNSFDSVCRIHLTFCFLECNVLLWMCSYKLNWLPLFCSFFSRISVSLSF